MFSVKVARAKIGRKIPIIVIGAYVGERWASAIRSVGTGTTCYQITSLVIAALLSRTSLAVASFGAAACTGTRVVLESNLAVSTRPCAFNVELLSNIAGAGYRGVTPYISTDSMSFTLGFSNCARAIWQAGQPSHAGSLPSIPFEEFCFIALFKYMFTQRMILVRRIHTSIVDFATIFRIETMISTGLKTCWILTTGRIRLDILIDIHSIIVLN